MSFGEADRVFDAVAAESVDQATRRNKTMVRRSLEKARDPSGWLRSKSVSFTVLMGAAQFKCGVNDIKEFWMRQGQLGAMIPSAAY